jgi:hypothetical protein
LQEHTTDITFVVVVVVVVVEGRGEAKKNLLLGRVPDSAGSPFS